MKAIHWIRSRQEFEELSYWLSIVSYNPKDRSFSNRMYLIYLLVFFSIWWFIVLVWFANTGGMLLSMLFPMAEMAGAVTLELLVLLIWFLTVLVLALRRSPVTFSEEDAYIVCQMPLGPRKLVLRWSFLPWIKSLIPFLILAMALGFSLADVALKAEGVTDPSVFAYVIEGLQAALVVIPIHLTAFALVWANGIWFMTHKRRKAAWIFPALTVLFVGVGVAAFLGVAVPDFIVIAIALLPAALMVGFGAGILGPILLIITILSVAAMGLMVLSAARFSASQAAQETQTQVSNRELRRYGFIAQVRERQMQKRLGTTRRTRWQPKWTGAAALIWKDLLETRRSFDILYFYQLLVFMGVGLGLVFIPTLGGRIILILTWAMQASKFLTARLREDLTHWTITRQAPLHPMRWILADLSVPSGIVLLAGMVGMLGGAALIGQFPLVEVLTLPGMIASMACVSAAVILKNARIDLLMAGRAPGVNEFGVLLITVLASLPVVVYSIVSGPLTTFLSVMASLFIAEMAIIAISRAYRSIA